MTLVAIVVDLDEGVAPGFLVRRCFCIEADMWTSGVFISCSVDAEGAMAVVDLIAKACPTVERLWTVCHGIPNSVCERSI